MSIRHLITAAAVSAIAAASSSAAPAAQSKPAPAKPATVQQAPNRAAIVRNLDSNFKGIDTNGDGSLSAAELAAAEGKVQQQRLAAVRARIDADFTKLDTNKDGQLSKAEFMAAAPTKPAAAPNGPALVANLDKNKDGKVTADEYRGPILARFDALDTNKDGTISDAERKAAAAKK